MDEITCSVCRLRRHQLGGGVQDTGGALTVLDIGSNLGGTAGHGQLGAIGGDPSDRDRRWQATSGVYMTDVISNH